MATRRRRSTPRPVEVTPEPTHEEMLEVAAEREAEIQFEETPEEEEKAIEVFMAMAVADTFEALMASEEAKGEEDFFDPGFYEQPQTEVRYPAKPTGVAPVAPAPQPLLSNRQPRYLTRSNRSSKYRRG